MIARLKTCIRVKLLSQEDLQYVLMLVEIQNMKKINKKNAMMEISQMEMDAPRFVILRKGMIAEKV